MCSLITFITEPINPSFTANAMLLSINFAINNYYWLRFIKLPLIYIIFASVLQPALQKGPFFMYLFNSVKIDLMAPAKPAFILFSSLFVFCFCFVFRIILHFYHCRVQCLKVRYILHNICQSLFCECPSFLPLIQWLLLHPLLFYFHLFIKIDVCIF